MLVYLYIFSRWGTPDPRWHRLLYAPTNATYIWGTSTVYRRSSRVGCRGHNVQRCVSSENPSEHGNVKIIPKYCGPRLVYRFRHVERQRRDIWSRARRTGNGRNVCDSAWHSSYRWVNEHIEKLTSTGIDARAPIRKSWLGYPILIIHCYHLVLD